MFFVILVKRVECTFIMGVPFHEPAAEHTTTPNSFIHSSRLLRTTSFFVLLIAFCGARGPNVSHGMCLIARERERERNTRPGGRSRSMTPSPRGALAMWWSVLAAVLVAWNPQRCVGQQPGDPADDTWRLKPPKPLLMPESHLGTTPWAERHVTVTMYSSKNLILYEIDNSGSWTQYTEEVVIDEPGTHIVTAVSSDSGILSENATAVYKVAAVAKVSTHLAASRAPATKSHDLCPRNCLKLTLPTPNLFFWVRLVAGLCLRRIPGPL